MASPALHPMRPSGWVDPRRPGEYPIVLGDSLKANGLETGRSSESLVNIRYNWQPKSGFGPRESKLTKSGDEEYRLSIPGRDPGDDGETEYVGIAMPSKSGKSDERTNSLALVFDKSRSCFVLEAISASLDLNLKYGLGHSSKEARELRQLPTSHSQSEESTQPKGAGSTSPAAEHETPDASNPYDFRHFLAEARENIEKSAQQQQAGNRTPLSGISTPVPGGNRFLATTPHFKPSPVTSHPAAQRKKKSDEPTRGGSRTTSNTPSMAPKAASKRNHPKSTSTTQPLSKARITDSDEEDDETPTEFMRPSTDKPSTASSTTKRQDPHAQRPTRPAGKGHARNISANIGSSPHIIINDDDGGLEIDMGSPPPEDRPTRRGRVDPEMFRSHTATPVAGMSSNAARSRPLSLTRPVVEEQDRGHKDRDVTMKDIEAGSDEDDDVEEFELGSPQEKRLSVPNSGDVSRMDDDGGDQEAESQDCGQHGRRQDPQPAPPTHVDDDDDDDDEDLLAAALEAALEEEEEQAAPHHHSASGVGLGIGMSGGVQDDESDESEVSEEE